MDPEIRALWERYKETGSARVREEIILNYSPLVKYVAGRVGVGLPDSIEHGDLVSYGMFGLIDAIERFDLAKGVKFETYAITRIRGAIIDELRSVDWVPRSVRSKSKRIDRAMHRLEARLKRTPTDEELAEEMEISLEDLHTMLDEVSYTSIAALDQTLNVGSDGDDRLTLVDTLQDATMIDPAGAVDDASLKRVLQQAIELLSEREQTVIGLYYFEGMTLAQIGDILGVTESRICQIHTKAVVSLKNKMTERIAG